MYRRITRCKPRGKLVKTADPDEHCVRVYKNSPGDLILQLWNGKRYMLVSLYPDEARDIATEMLLVAAQIETKESVS